MECLGFCPLNDPFLLLEIGMNAFLTSCVGGFVGALFAILLVQAILHYRKVKKESLPTGEDHKPEVPAEEPKEIKSDVEDKSGNQ